MKKPDEITQIAVVKLNAAKTRDDKLRLPITITKSRLIIIIAVIHINMVGMLISIVIIIAVNMV
ncbi:MAG: hypothetical protein WCV79_01215 [Candidatus Paceibacterota bacterium]